MSFLGDLFQSIVILERAEALQDSEQSNLLKDGSQIQRLVAELHGRQRYRMGWTKEALKREYEILDDEIASLVKKYGSNASGAAGVDWGLRHTTHLLSRAHEASFVAYEAAEREGEGRAQENGHSTEKAPARQGST